MPDNQPFVSPLNPPGFFPLDDHSVLALEGPEAIAFAHAQFSSDVTSLAVGHWQWSTWLTAKGRVLAVFALLRTGEHALRLVLPDVDAAELADALRRYVFRRKVTLAARPDLRVTGAFAAPAQARGPLLAGDEAVAPAPCARAGCAPGRASLMHRMVEVLRSWCTTIGLQFIPGMAA